ncbi:YdcF family protein [Photobacterium alginatilyticum]|uniref:YdcF family protein n=1 Tax=Photobacterium alginatilyticum TaxID=1775171 RepID=A0ABW9YKG1_9GAMM|nr:YdcF family protein [Photobacterium alginatilyticum]NBI54299.1 YdcF family protein [Photobacterium alginatilyticum]
MAITNLQQALDAYNSSNRSQYPLNGNLVTNLEAVEYYLAQAAPKLPDHFGLPITLANMQTFRGEITPALHCYRRCLMSAGSAPERCQVLTYLVVWSHHEGDSLQVQLYLEQLRLINDVIAANVKALLAILDNILSTPTINTLSNFTHSRALIDDHISNKHAIIALGYVLNDDGSMAPQLIQRLELTLRLAKQLSESLIIVTGGLAKRGKTESQQMKHWLIQHGISSNRIIEENKATNTIDNARLSLDLLKQLHIRSATLVSASIHVHRSQLLFETLQCASNLSPISFSHLAVKDGISETRTPTGRVRRNCYIDALRGFGLPAFNCKPLVQI